MKRVTFLSVILICTFLFVSAKSIGLNGSWEGKLNISPELSLRIVLNITDNGTDGLAITMDSPDQGAYGLPMVVVESTPYTFTSSYNQAGITVNGSLMGSFIMGEFEQGGLKLPITLLPKVKVRPQTPVGPFPYNTEEVTFKSAADEIKLDGTLTLPGNADFSTPIAVMITGSGLQNRDEEIFDHKPFAVIADYLARNGIGSLRYDDRGFDRSRGILPNENSEGNMLDALGAINFLKDRGYKKIGIIGHSEGGLIADMIASKDKNLAFVIEIGGPSVPGDMILLFQNRKILSDAQMPDNIVTMYNEAMKGYFDSQKDVSPVEFDESQYEIFSEKWVEDPVVAPLVKNLKDNFAVLAPWLRYFINYDPLSDLKQIEAPLMMIYGGKDIQVPADMNGDVVKKEVPKALLKIYPDNNHLMQTCKTGNIGEYDQIEETISPDVLSDIKEFILSIR